ncbi:hypothetical protein NLJ89_g2966 [Agrocybe chaxingu]|uniref:Uncharacterized protein n=1 Tax=Agrocybe chaxingu TaxID=84603 RepID=A0A9W8K5K3_9AGAR|nr:hypothetical protein NLJ89_g2966 [Agrocybe chaxingu]
MALLPPALAYQYTISTYVYVGTLAVLVWDILSHTRQDFRLIFRYPVRLPAMVYALSRMASLAFVLSTVIYQTAPVGIPCRVFCKVVEWLFAVAVPTTSLLFLFRLLAIFDRNNLVRAIFGTLWLAVVAGVLTPTQGLVGANIGPTKYCINVSVEEYVGAAAVIPLVNDTLIFLAISWKLMRNAHINAHPLRSGHGPGLRGFLSGEYLPAFSRGLLHDGQAYYLTTVTTNLMTVVVFYFTFIPAVYRAMFAVPNAILMNMMACRVYRRTKLALKNVSNHPTTSVSKDAPIIPLAFMSKRYGVQNSNDMAEGKDESIKGIEVVGTVEHHEYRFREDERTYVKNTGTPTAV